MAKMDFNKVPRFAELPVKKGAPEDSSWGVFGDDDELGCLNFLTPEAIVEAAGLVRHGKVFRLDTKINYATPPLFNRNPAKHTILSFASYGLLGHDDSIDNYNTQEGSQWDGLGHVGHIKHQAYYNGVKDDQIKDGPGGKLSIHKWANKVVGRGVLIDAFKYRNEAGRPLNPLTDEKYTLKDLQDALKAQAGQLKPGSILLVRTGWMQAYEKASPCAEDRDGAAGGAQGVRHRSIARDGRMAMGQSRRRHRHRLPRGRAVAVGASRTRARLHYRTLSMLGLPLGEQFILDPLAADCAADKRYEFMLVSVPMNLEGGIASPPNAVAIK